MRTLIYTRFSNDDPDSPSCDRQIQDATEWIATNGHELVGTYRDDGWSGGLSHRPGIDALLADHAGAGQVVVRDWYRIGRGRAFAYLMTRLEEDCGLRVVSLTGMQDDELMQDVKGVVVGGEYRRSTSRAVKLHMLGKAKRGEYTGGKSLYGYRWVEKTKRIIVPEEAVRVREVADMYDMGLPKTEISRRTGFGRQRICRMLEHPGYAGAYSYARTHHVKGRRNQYRRAPAADHIVTWGAHEPIIPLDQWDRIQARLDTERNRFGTHDGRLSLALSQLLVCTSCNQFLRVQSFYTDADGHRTYWYACETSGCPGVGRVNTRGWTEAMIAFRQHARLDGGNDRLPAGPPVAPPRRGRR